MAGGMIKTADKRCEKLKLSFLLHFSDMCAMAFEHPCMYRCIFMMLKRRKEMASHVMLFTEAGDIFHTVHAHLLAQVVQADQDYLEALRYLLVQEFLVFL